MSSELFVFTSASLVQTAQAAKPPPCLNAVSDEQRQPGNARSEEQSF